MAPQKPFNAAAKNLGKQLLQSVDKFNAELFAISLIEKHADLSQKDKSGNTALILAAQGGKALAVKSLLAHQADAGVTNRNGHNALALAILHGHDKIAHLLADHGATLTAVQIVDLATAPAAGKTATLLREIATRQDAAQKQTAAAPRPAK